MRVTSVGFTLIGLLFLAVGVSARADLVKSRDAEEPEQSQPQTQLPGLPAPSTSRFRIGPTFGLNASTIVCDSCDYSVVRGRLGVGFGGTFEYLFNEYMALEVETMYLQKGVALYDSGSFQGNLNYNTIEFPVSFKGRFGGRRVKGVVFGGPQFGIAVSRTQTAAGVAGTKSLPAKSVDFGVHIGGGVEFQVDPLINLFINGRFNIGLTDVALDPDFTEAVHTFGLLFLGGIKFSL